MGARRVPKVLILFETPRRSPGRNGTGEALGLRRGLTRVVVGLAAGRNAVLELVRLLPGLNCSAVSDGESRDRCGLAAGRGEPAGRALFGLALGLIANGELIVIGEATPVDGVERIPGDTGTPVRANPRTLPACRGCGLIAGREAPAWVTGCARGLPEGRALGTAGFGLPPPGVVRAGNVALCAEGGRAAQPTAGGGTTGAALLGGGGPLVVL